MVFNDSTGGQGIVQDIDFNCGSDINSYTLIDKTRNVNNWMSRVAFLIESANNTWLFDDRNNTDFPIATTDLVSGQPDYKLDVTHLIVRHLEIADSTGNWNNINAIHPDDPDFKRISNDSSTGVPTRYAKIGSSIILYPTPNYNYGISYGNSVGGLRAYFQRDLSYFKVSDTTKAPGFNQQFHKLLSIGASYDFCKKNQLPQKNDLFNDIQISEQGLLEFYSSRSKDDAPKMKAIRILTR